MSRVIPLASVVMVLVLSACLPVTSSSPLGTTVAANRDPRLTGMWKGRVGSAGAAHIVFYPDHEGVRKILVIASPAVDDDGGWLVFEARGATLGGKSYLDARELEDDGKAPDPKLSHVSILYSIGADGSLVFYLIDEAAARRAIGKGAIAGTVEPGEFGDIRITAGPVALDRFFASAAGRALFTRPLGILRREK